MKHANPSRPPAVVMNMFATGLGIARSLGERGIPVIGLTAQPRVYGNFTRYARVMFSPDSRHEPEELAAFLIRLGRDLGRKAVVFPTRDDDLVFLDRFRAQLTAYFDMVVPGHEALEASLNKWETYLRAREAGVEVPVCWLIEGAADLERAAGEAAYPCVLKPLSAHHWRQGRNWELVGARKAIAVASEKELRAEYAAIGRADQRALLQQMVPGSDESLAIMACYMDRRSRWVAGFNTQKILQLPEGFGTGCVVQSTTRSELVAPTERLLESIGFSGIAEVEYKWDAAARCYKLIEINPRPWDQHRLGNTAGVDLIYIAYCEHAGLPLPAAGTPIPGHKWVAEDALVSEALRAVWSGKPSLGWLFGRARGRRIYAIWSPKDPLPALAYWTFSFVPLLFRAGLAALRSVFRKKSVPKVRFEEKELVYETQVEKPQSLR